jgi:hypothetical protein
MQVLYEEIFDVEGPAGTHEDGHKVAGKEDDQHQIEEGNVEGTTGLV